jgi:hypothetical protein
LDPIRKAISHSRQNNSFDHSNTSSNKIDRLAYSGNNLVPIILPPVHNRRHDQKKRTPRISKKRTEDKAAWSRSSVNPTESPSVHNSRWDRHLLAGAAWSRSSVNPTESPSVHNSRWDRHLLAGAALNRGTTIDNQNLISWYKGRGP